MKNGKLSSYYIFLNRHELRLYFSFDYKVHLSNNMQSSLIGTVWDNF